jgi:phosphate transport system substrate-binding protein
MKIATGMILFLICMIAGSAAAEEKVLIGGSGSLTDDMEELAKAYVAKHPSDAIEMLDDSKRPMSNTGGMEGVKQGRMTIGLVTREPKGEEKEKLAYRAVGRTPAGVAVNKSLPITSLTEVQICDIFSGKVKSWKEVGGPDTKIMVLTRKKDDANTETIRAKMACFKNLQISADAIALQRGGEVLDAIDTRATAVGLVNIGTTITERPNAKALAIDGIAPGPETVQSGKYKFFTERGAVTLGAPQGAAKRFLDFVASAEGQKILARRGSIPLAAK